ncbi:MAG: hypothetical protein Q8O98_01900 [bacterium]|nr:hypothetical protein [bacterium]
MQAVPAERSIVSIFKEHMNAHQLARVFDFINSDGNFEEDEYEPYFSFKDEPKASIDKFFSEEKRRMAKLTFSVTLEGNDNKGSRGVFFPRLFAVLDESADSEKVSEENGKLLNNLLDAGGWHFLDSDDPLAKRLDELRAEVFHRMNRW